MPPFSLMMHLFSYIRRKVNAMKHSHIDNAEYSVSQDGVKFTRLYASNKVVVAHIILAPGQIMAPHSVPGDACIYVMEGEPEIALGDEKGIFPAGSVIESPKNIEKTLSNPGSTPATVMIVREM